MNKLFQLFRRAAISFVLALGTVAAFAQNVTVNGMITDAATGEALSGAIVQLRGSNTVYASSDGAGVYSISVPANGTLVFTLLGYTSQEIAVAGRQTIDVALAPDVNSLDELVVIGYGMVKKRDLTGAISQVGSDKLEDRPYGNALQSIAGQLAGVNITTTQGAPGMAPTIRVRGMSSINSGTAPLYVIDGIPLEDNTTSTGTNGGDVLAANRNPMNNINPGDIESIEILKDASSAAIYGSRGANGVVIITTKNGRAGRTKVDLNYEYGISKVLRTIDMMNAPQWMEFETAARNNSYATALLSNPSLTRESNTSKYVVPSEFSDPAWVARIGNGTDWQDVLLQTAQSHNIQATVSGGNDRTQFLVSGNYLTQDGVVDRTYYNRYSFRSNINHKINDRATVSMKVALTHSQDYPNGLSGKSDAVSLAVQSDPIFPLYVETGSLGFKDPESIWNTFVKYGFQLWHPYSLTREMTKKRTTNTVLFNTYLDYKIIDGLTFRTALNARNEDMNFNSYWNEGQNWGYSGWVNAQGSYSTLHQFNWAWENTLNYAKTFGDHSVTGLLGYTMQDQHTTTGSFTGKGYANDMVHTLNAATSVSGKTQETEWSLISYLARATYSYQGKYLASAAIRADGCSRFGANNKWGYFPSASLAWRVSEEDFMADTRSWLDELKFRVSYGMTGNNQIDDYGAIGLLGYSAYVVNGANTQGMYTNTMPDPDVRWEKTWQVNLGADATMFNDRLTATLDFYYSRTNDLLLEVPVPVLTGFQTSLSNVGSLQNKGVELNIVSHNIETSDFSWTTDFNIYANRNKVLSLGTEDSPILVNTNSSLSLTEVNEPMGNYYGYKILGVLSTAEAAAGKGETNGVKWAAPAGSEGGDPKVFDFDGNGKIDATDRVILGNYQADFSWGMTNSFKFRNVDFSFMLNGVHGNEIMNQNARFLGEFNGDRGVYASSYNFWRSDSNPGDGWIPKPRTVNTGVRGQCTSYWIDDGSFVRIKNVRLGYTFPARLVERAHIASARIYVNLENVYVFSDYRNYDPENSTFQTGYRLGYDYGAYPTPFSCSFGVNLTF